MNMIYLDNAATTQISDGAFEAMLPYLKERYGNASSIYKLGRDNALALANARSDIAECIGASPKEVYFTGCGSESNNWAIKGGARLAAKKGKRHIISSAFEHHAVLHTLQALERDGFEVTYLPVYEDGVVRRSDLEAAIREDTGLVTVMYVNNEIGTIQPIAEIGEICKRRGILFHTDAVQAAGNLPINVKELNADLLTLSAHKIHAPKGVGLLYINAKVRLAPFIDGGAQERGLRAGTENTAGIIAFAFAMKAATEGIERKNALLLPFKQKIIDAVAKIPRTRLNGSQTQSVANIVNCSILGVEGEALLLMLDNQGIAASSGSACTSGSLDPSHVLLALGLPHEVAHGSLRISMSEYTTEAEIDRLLEKLPPIVEKLRGMSPLWERISNDQLKFNMI
jgi:cysteine desulfurase